MKSEIPLQSQQSCSLTLTFEVFPPLVGQLQNTPPLPIPGPLPNPQSNQTQSKFWNVLYILKGLGFLLTADT